MVNVTRTEFHGSTFATRSDSPLPEQQTLISEKKFSSEIIPIVIRISTPYRANVSNLYKLIFTGNTNSKSLNTAAQSA